MVVRMLNRVPVAWTKPVRRRCQMEHKLLSQEEFECLRSIASGAGWQAGCSQSRLHALVAQGLIEAVPRWAFPGLSSVVEYRVTAAGRQRLKP
jgi:hypothetical protein